MTKVECVARGYLTGSGLADYRRTGTVCGIPLAEGLTDSSRLPEPIFTPTTKADQGHDQPMTFAEVVDQEGADRAEELRARTLEIYRRGVALALEKGIIIADTKVEFGCREDGTLVLADEVLTPDSSRFWDAATWEPGRGQDSFDKQIVRDWAAGTGWDKTPPGPPVPDDVVARTRARYIEVYERLTGLTW
jgi:phosphoribosylaminoimidazole-succinocarboxamide synthase